MREVCPRRRLERIMELPNLFEVSENFLPQAQITELQTSLHAGNLAQSTQQLSTGMHNQNVLYVINDKGLQTGSLEPSLLQLFQQMRHPKANFWKYQVNWLTGNSRGAEGELGTRRTHADQWVLRKGTDTCRLLAFQTSILYVSIPKNMRGGEISLFKKGTAGSKSTFIDLIKLTPADNMLITFQGDIPHQVQDFETDDPTPRVSIALEQFYVPQDLYDLTVEFDVIRPPGATSKAD
ncbi:hypothetical protein COCOBI_02-8600 [Coccomyxa sp. Obi]|nr:hypothetical protein COCOBI_02-8600 [Coccomyxa sp. Obi]